MARITHSIALSSVLPASPLAAQVSTETHVELQKQATRFSNQPHYSPYARRDYTSQPLWGETHLHTSRSPYAIAGGEAATAVVMDMITRQVTGTLPKAVTGNDVQFRHVAQDDRDRGEPQRTG